MIALTCNLRLCPNPGRCKETGTTQSCMSCSSSLMQSVQPAVSSLMRAASGWIEGIQRALGCSI